MTRRSISVFATISALALLIAACSAPAGTSDDVVVDVVVDVQVISQEGNPVIGAAFALVDASIHQASVIDMGEGGYLTSLVQVDADGRASVRLPAAASLPAGALASAEEAFPATVQGSACSAAADPASARISVMSFEGVVVPSIVAVSTEVVAESIVVTDEADAIDHWDQLEVTLYGWVYADRDVTLTLTGAGCGAGDPVALSAGWNQFALDYDRMANTATLRRSSATDLLVVLLDAEPLNE